MCQNFLSKSMNIMLVLMNTLFVFLPILANAKCICEENNIHGSVIIPKLLIEYKLAAIASILFASAFGVCTPLFLKNSKYLQPDTPIHFLIKSFAAGVILSTGFIHILPDAFESLNNPCLGEKPWGDFPLTGLIAMASAVATLMMEYVATAYHKRDLLKKALPLDGDVEQNDNLEHVHGPTILFDRSNSSNLVRSRIISQVLELGMVVHSVIIGISLGTSHSIKIVKPLIAGLSFHQFFEGLGLGACINQAKFKGRTVTTMVLFFSLTTPIGIAIGIGISKSYDESSSTSLIVEGILNSASAGILIYMALVDLLAADFMNPKLQNNFKLQLGTNFTLLLGACVMSLLAINGAS